MRWPHERDRCALSAVLVASMAALSLASTPGSAAASPDANTWRVASTLALGTNDTAISCPTSTRCWAIEAGELIATTDAGLTWVVLTAGVPDGVVALNDLTCPSVAICYLTAVLDNGRPAVVVLQAGVMTAFAAPGSEPLPTISCPGGSHCMVTDGRYAYVTQDGAAHWSTYLLPGVPTISSLALSCVRGTSTCWLTGNYGETPIIEKSTDDGVSWESQTAPALTDGMNDVECPSLRTCYAVGSTFSDYATVIGTHNGGQTWVKQDTPVVGFPLYSVSCASKTTCWAGGLSPGRTPYIFATTDSGDQWDTQQLPGSTSEGSPYLSCPGTEVCVAVSGAVTYETDDGGATWAVVGVPAAVAPPQFLGCPTRTHCVALSSDAVGRASTLTSEDGGATWTTRMMPVSPGRWSEVDCPAASVCYAISATTPPRRPHAPVSHVLSSVDGGASWHEERIPGKRGLLYALSCPTTTTCLAVGRRQTHPRLILTTDSGHTWVPVAAPPGVERMGGVSCTSVTACVLTTQNQDDPSVAWTTSDLGATYEPHAMPPGHFYELDCSGLTCVALGLTTVFFQHAMTLSVDGGVTWDLVTLPDFVLDLGRVSCGSETVCAVTADASFGAALIVDTTDAGQTWKVFRVPARPRLPVDVACFKASCIASDDSPTGNPLILAGRA